MSWDRWILYSILVCAFLGCVEVAVMAVMLIRYFATGGL